MSARETLVAAGVVIAALGCSKGGGGGGGGGSRSVAATTSRTAAPVTSRPAAATPAAPRPPAVTPVGGPADPSADGPWKTRQVTVSTLVAGQASFMDVRLPVGTQGPRPTVVICHGWVTQTTLYEGIAEHLASRGFAAALFQQPNIFSTSTPDWADQLRGAIDALDAATAAGGALAGEIDLAHIGLVGHSYGGAAAIWAGADDKRVKAVVALTPVNQYHFADLKTHAGRLAIPFMEHAGENDVLAVPATYARPIFDAATAAPDRLYVEVAKGAHMNFCDTGKGSREYHLSSQYMTAWLERFLGGAADPGGFTDGTQAQRDLTAGALSAVR